MITVTFDGVEYTKAAHVAKEFGYTADYLGQLCRAKKVNARLVGRSWFINIPSLEAHREKKYQKVSNKKVQEESVESAPELKEKSDKASKNYLRRVPPPHAPSRRFTQTQTEDGAVRHVSLHYEEDDHSLIPKVSDRPKVTLLKVDVAGSEPLPVKSTESGKNTLKPEPLPEVSLSGSLKVSTVEDIEETPASVEEKAQPVKKSSKHTSFRRDKSKNKLIIKEVEALVSEHNAEKKTKSEPVVQHDSAKLNTADQSESLTFEQKLAHEEETGGSTQGEIPVQGDSVAQLVRIDFKLPALGVVTGVLFGALILSLEQVVMVTTEVADFTFSIDWKNIANMALVLFTG